MDIKDTFSERVKALVDSGKFPIFSKTVQSSTILTDLRIIERNPSWFGLIEYYFLGFLDETLKDVSPEEYFEVLRALHLEDHLWVSGGDEA